MLELKDISKAFDGKAVLREISFRVKPNEVVAILGGSGAGKSTIINCINGLVAPDSGVVSVNGQSGDTRAGRQSIRQHCATVFQNFNLYPHLTILQNVTLAPIQVLNLAVDKANQQALELLNSVGLADQAMKYPAQLSGGQKQRVGICRALAMTPQYLLLDEVTSSLDPEMTAEVVDVLQSLAEKGIGMILVTHEINVARKIATRILFLEHGNVVHDMEKNEFFSADFLSENERIARFVQSSVSS